MALSVLDGQQTSTTLSSVVTGGEHIVAHTVVSLGSVAISNISSAVSGSAVTVPNLNRIIQSVATEGITDGTLNFIKIGGHQDGSNQTAHIVHVSAGGALKVDASGSTQPISGTVTANVPAATNINDQLANLYASNSDDPKWTAIPIGFNDTNADHFYNVSNDNPLPVTGSVNISGTVPVSGTFWQATQPISGTVTANLSSSNLNSITIGVRGTVTAGISSIPVTSVTYVQSPNANFIPTDRTLAVFGGVDLAGARWGPIPLSNDGAAVIATGSVEATQPLYPFTNTPRPYVVTVGNSITISSLPSISGTVTASVSSTTVTVSALPNGALTTRFGSVTTANTAQITSAVTNTSRKYLLAQNISAGTVTIGIGFSPTTTQGIQLTAGAGLTFDSFCPTGAVYWLGATTGATFTILEG